MLVRCGSAQVGGDGVRRGPVRLDPDGRLHAAAVRAVPDPPSLLDLRGQLEAMLRRVDVGELVLEVMAWQPGFLAAFTAVSGGGVSPGWVICTSASRPR